jgi:hypothetical protein
MVCFGHRLKQWLPLLWELESCIAERWPVDGAGMSFRIAADPDKFDTSPDFG